MDVRHKTTAGGRKYPYTTKHSRLRRARCLIASALSAGMILSGCAVQYAEESRIADIEYEVIERASEVPDAVADMISRQGGSPYMLTFSDGETLYIARGYGSDHLPGCTVTAEEVYETEHAVCIRTRISGRDRREEHFAEGDRERQSAAQDAPGEKGGSPDEEQEKNAQEETGRATENPGILIRMRDLGKEVVFL